MLKLLNLMREPTTEKKKKENIVINNDERTVMTTEMKKDLREIYEDAMDYGTGYFKLEDWDKKHGEVKWNVGEFDGFYIADGIIQVR